jgi:F420-dependent oxidoreductase-like protein
VRIGLQVSDFASLGSPQEMGPRLAEVARTADENGFASFWVPDHLLNAMSVMGEPLDAPVLEGHTTIAFVAAVTRRVRVGLQVTCPLFRHPAVLVKMVSTIDVLSGGRACLGLGAGWFEREAAALGIEFPALPERFGRLRETLLLARHMWADNREPFEGRYYRLAEPINAPQPVTRPHPPIMIGGEGERTTLRLVATHADACNIRLGYALEDPTRLDMLAGKLAVLRRHCLRVGRPYEEVDKTVQVFIRRLDRQEASRLRELCRRLTGLGVGQTIVNLANVADITPVRLVADEVVAWDWTADRD